MSGVTIGSNSVIVNGKIIETVKTIGITNKINTTPITSEPILDIDDNHKYIAFTHKINAYSVYRFRIINTRGGGQAQFSEIDFFDTNGENIIPITAIANTVVNPSENASNTIDNNTNTKWIGNTGNWLIYTFSAPFVLSHYQWITANDVNGRDPTRWVIEIFKNSVWIILNDTNYTSNTGLVPTARFAKVGPFFINPQIQYSINFPENTECDILVVGGGGGGGSDNSGGGGAGGLVFIQNYIANGSYILNVGNGGLGALGNQTTNSFSGNSSSFNKASGGVDGTTDFIAMGGGGGGTGDVNLQNGIDGGSGGGSAYESIQGTAGNTNQQTYIGYDGIKRGFGNDGGIGYNASTGQGAGGGGGGAGEKGFNSGTSPGTTNIWGGKGGNGLSEVNGIDFKTHFNLQANNTLGEYISTENKTYFAGGGGGGNDNNTVSIGTPLNNIGGKGGGADGIADPVHTIPNNASANSGGGGGGKTWSDNTANGGAGGSGIVIIRYKIIKENYDAQWTYNPSNLNVHHMGNVGIGTTNPTTALEVVGSISASIGISALSKTFKIEHPLNTNKLLYHGCIEAPRFDNLYRGKKIIKNGTCEVNIDSECNDTGGMTEGTFIALNINSQLYIRNNETFDGVKGNIVGGKIIINCQNTIDDIEVDWLVIGERKDENVINVPLTNIEGNLICEHNID